MRFLVHRLTSPDYHQPTLYAKTMIAKKLKTVMELVYLRTAG